MGSYSEVGESVGFRTNGFGLKSTSIVDVFGELSGVADFENTHRAECYCLSRHVLAVIHRRLINASLFLNNFR